MNDQLCGLLTERKTSSTCRLVLHRNGNRLTKNEVSKRFKYYVRQAGINDKLHFHAFKNLGMSLRGQGKLGEAALSFVAAVRADAADPRALKHLEELVAEHEELYEQVPDLDFQIQNCRKAVEFVKRSGSDQTLPGRN